VSIENSGESIDLNGLTDPACTEIKGIADSDVLLKFSNAFMEKDEARLSKAREQLANTISPEAMVDAAAIASNFQRMVRIADSTGIPLESMGDDMDGMVEELNEQLGINKYASAVNTPKR
jgi:uncharacterized protein with NRDE domain